MTEQLKVKADDSGVYLLVDGVRKEIERTTLILGNGIEVTVSKEMFQEFRERLK